jgi:hypothetical protein
MRTVCLFLLALLIAGCGGPPGHKGKGEKNRPPRPAMDE